VDVPELVPLVPVPAPVDDPALFAPLVPLLDEPARFPVLVPVFVLVDDPALLAPLLRSELVPVLVRVRSVSLVLVPVLLLLGRVVGSLLDEPEPDEVPLLLSRLRVPVLPVSLLSHPINAMPPSASAAATRIP